MNQLLHYLIKAHEMDWDIKRSLEDNASKLILTSGIIIPIFFGLVLISDKNLDIVQIFFPKRLCLLLSLKDDGDYHIHN